MNQAFYRNSFFLKYFLVQTIVLTHATKSLNIVSVLALIFKVFFSFFAMEKTSSPTDTGKNKIFSLARHLDVWVKEGCRMSLTHKKKDPNDITFFVSLKSLQPLRVDNSLGQNQHCDKIA